MRDEFMNVEGQASTDEDMFASLRERSVEIEESQDAAEAENVDDVSGNEQENSRENTEDSDFSGVDDLFAASSAVFSSDIRPSTDVTAMVVEKMVRENLIFIRGRINSRRSRRRPGDGGKSTSVFFGRGERSGCWVLLARFLD